MGKQKQLIIDFDKNTYSIKGFDFEKMGWDNWYIAIHSDGSILFEGDSNIRRKITTIFRNKGTPSPPIYKSIVYTEKETQKFNNDPRYKLMQSLTNDELQLIESLRFIKKGSK